MAKKQSSHPGVSIYPRKDSPYIWIKWTDPKSGKKFEKSTAQIVRPMNSKTNPGEKTPCLKNTKEGDLIAEQICMEIWVENYLGNSHIEYIRQDRFQYRLLEALELYFAKKSNPIQDKIKKLASQPDEFIKRKKRRKNKKNRKLSASTIKLTQDAVKLLVKAIGNKFIGDYTEEDFDYFETFMDNYEFYRGKTKKIGLAAHSQAIYSRQIKSLFNWFIEQEWIEVNPVIEIEATETDPKPFSKEELFLIFEDAKNNLNLFEACLVLFTTALRAEDCTSLIFEKVDFKNKLIYYYNQKTDNWNSCVPLDPALEMFWQKKYNGRVPFKGEILKYSSYNGLYGSWRFLKKRTGIKGGLHRWRHTYSTILTDNNLEISKAQKILNHSDMQVTKKHYDRKEVSTIGKEVSEKIKFSNYISGNLIDSADLSFSPEELNNILSNSIKQSSNLYLAVLILLTTNINEEYITEIEYEDLDLRMNYFIHQKIKYQLHPAVKKYIIESNNNRIPVQGNLVKFKNFDGLRYTWGRVMTSIGYTANLSKLKITRNFIAEKYNNDLELFLQRSQIVAG